MAEKTAPPPPPPPPMIRHDPHKPKRTHTVRTKP